MGKNLTNIRIPQLDTSSLVPKLKLEGHWEQASVLINNIENIISRSYYSAVRTFSRQLVSIVKNSIISGTPPKGSNVYWAPHAPSTIKRYGAHPLLNLTGKYARVIGVYEYKGKTYIGVPYNLKIGKKRKLTMGALARILEYGTDDGKIPDRPVWQPSLKSIGGKIKLSQMIKTNIRREIMAKTGLKSNQIKWK